MSGLTTEEREDGQGHLPSHNESISGITVHQPLQRSKLSAYKSCLFAKQLTNFSASSFYPGRGDTGDTLPASRLFLTTDNQPNGTGDVSDVETEADWLDEPDLEEPGPRGASKFSEAVAIEVRPECVIK